MYDISHFFSNPAEVVVAATATAAKDVERAAEYNGCGFLISHRRPTRRLTRYEIAEWLSAQSDGLVPRPPDRYFVCC